MKLDPTNLPRSVATLLSIAEKWGIADDYNREMKIASANSKDLIELVNGLNRIDGDTLCDWLEGSDSYSASHSKEYIAFTCLTMTIDSAKNQLKRRGVTRS